MSDSKSITNAIFDSYYPRSKNFPNGKIVVENTSFSKNGVFGKTLTSRTISEAISGDVLYRSPKFAATFYNKSIGSSLNSLITAGSESTFDSPSNLTIEDPESIAIIDDNGTKKATTLKGGAAFARILADSISGKQGGSSFVQDAGESLYDNYISSETRSNQDPNSSDPDESIGNDPGIPGAGGRMVVLSSKITEEEKGWILERGKVLADTGLFEGRGSSLRSGWAFDIVDGLTGIKTKDGASEFPGIDPSTNTIDVSREIIDAPSQTAYIAPALIEFLIMLSSKISYYAGFGTSRFSDDPVKNHMTNNNSLSAHGFGRAVDISSVTTKDGVLYDIWNNAGNLDIYRNFMEVLLPAINSMPMHLIPDLLGFAGPLKTEYGVTNGKDADDAAIKLRFPNLKYVRWYPADDHLNHIHISFSPARAGIYTGPGGAFTTGPTAPLTLGDIAAEAARQAAIAAGTITNPGNILDSKYTKSYKVPNTGELSQDEIFQLLTGTIAYPELAALFTAITAREGNVGSWNPKILNSGDYSFGCFQINLLAHGNKTYMTPLPTVAITEGWKLAATAWEYFGLTNFDQWKSFATSIAKSKANEETPAYIADSRNSTSDRLWIPINQAFMLYKMSTGTDPVYPLPADQKLGLIPEMRHVLQPWGDYGGAVGSGAPTYGPISNVKWSDAAGVYLRNTNKTEETLKTWVRRYFAFAGNGATSRSAPVIERWMNGEEFKGRL